VLAEGLGLGREEVREHAVEHVRSLRLPWMHSARKNNCLFLAMVSDIFRQPFFKSCEA
jgi:hypothetical protein